MNWSDDVKFAACGCAVQLSPVFVPCLEGLTSVHSVASVACEPLAAPLDVCCNEM